MSASREPPSIGVREAKRGADNTAQIRTALAVAAEKVAAKVNERDGLSPQQTVGGERRKEPLSTNALHGARWEDRFRYFSRPADGEDGRWYSESRFLQAVARECPDVLRSLATDVLP